MPTPPPSLTYSILMFNEEDNILGALREAHSYLDAHLEHWEILVVDDGSTDRSAAIVEQFIADHPRVRLLSHERNKGMGAGIRTAIRAAACDYFTFNAADGQIPVSSLTPMLEALSRGEVVLTTYESGRESLIRGSTSSAFRVFLSLAAGIRFELEGIYLIPAPVAKELSEGLFFDTFFFSFAMIQDAVDRGLTTADATITCVPRNSGASKVFNLKRIRAVAKEALAYGCKRRAARR